jgi:uncharacterized protein (TIGR02757 family)
MSPRVRLPVAPRVAEILDDVRARCDVAARLELDPVAVVHRYPGSLDRELVGLMASAVAFGNVKALRAKLEQALARLGPNIAEIADHDLLIGARRVQRASGSLGERFAADLAREGKLRPALAAFTAAVRTEGGLGRSKQRRGGAHILADPSGASGCKRLLLYLRWMIRPADGVDLGLWNLPPSLLLVPVDTHIHKLSLNLGFTKRRSLSWKTSEEITEALRQFDREDPAKYDFALCHMGMLQRCPSRRDPARCDGCGVLTVCRHWTRRRPS